jgi:lipid-binding SYLF domain-containing protein
LPRVNQAPSQDREQINNKKQHYMISKLKFTAGLILVAIALFGVRAASADDLTRESHQALQELVAQNPAAARANSHALGVLVFPNVVKAGFIVGAQGGKGVLFVHGKPAGRYRTVAASYGLQAGAQKYGYALFFMDQKSVDWINTTRGWEIGTGPSVVIVDKGMARSFTSASMHSGIYAFTFDQQGLMAGLGLQGSKIKRLD